MEMDSIL
jgi:putative transposase